MPNGDPRNWFRLLIVLNGFRATYGHWPTRLRVYEPFVADFKDHVFDERAFNRFTDLLELIPDSEAFDAEDDMGNVFRYGQDEVPEGQEVDLAEEWLGIQPRYVDYG